MAFKHEFEDRKRADESLQAIQNMLTPIGSALGVEYTKSTKQAPTSKALPDDLPVEDVLKMIGGKNIMVKTHGQ